MDKEFVQLKALLENATMEQHHKKDFAVGTIGGKEIVIQKCGIGKVNSAIGAVEMINNYAPRPYYINRRCRRSRRGDERYRRHCKHILLLSRRLLRKRMPSDRYGHAADIHCT